jgi:hemerythrin superfamily protein
MNALKLLTDDHRRHEALLERMKTGKEYAEFRDELIRHVHMEEEIFYPRLFEIPDLKDAVTLALEEHTLCMQLLQELDREEMTQSLRDAKLTILSGLLLGHERREEEELFPLVKELATTEYLNEVGTQMRIQKKETDPEEVLYPGEEEQKEKFFSRVRNSPPA